MVLTRTCPEMAAPRERPRSVLAENGVTVTRTPGPKVTGRRSRQLVSRI